MIMASEGKHGDKPLTPAMAVRTTIHGMMKQCGGSMRGGMCAAQRTTTEIAHLTVLIQREAGQS